MPIAARVCSPVAVPPGVVGVWGRLEPGVEGRLDAGDGSMVWNALF